MQESMTILNWVMGGGFLAMVLLNISTYKKTNEDKKDTDKQIGRIFQRLDEVKDKADISYTKKDVCEVVHKSVDKILQEVKDKVECIPKIKAGIDLLLQKNGLKNKDD